MNINDPTIVLLREKVRAAQDVFDMAVTLHEVWKPAAKDTELHKRLGVSYATQAFNVVRVALRREMVLALMRLWDNDPRAIGMQSIAKTLGDASVIGALRVDRASRIKITGVDDEIRQTLAEKANEIIALVADYSDGGAKFEAFKKLRTLRNQRLAHTQVKAHAFTAADAIDADIEVFYQDNSRLISLLLSLADAMAYDPQDTAEVYRHYATFFWASVRGEKSEGHPSYRPPSPPADAPSSPFS
jgi:AbiU2